MKKLIMAVAVVAAAAAVHASQFSWGLGSGSLDATKFANGTAYLFYGSNGSTPSLPDTTTWATKTLFTAADLVGTGATQLQTATIKNGLFEVEVEDPDNPGTFIKVLQTLAQTSTVTPSNVGGGSAATKATKFYMAVLSADGQTVALTTVQQKTIAKATTGVSAAWSPEDISVFKAAPEPTSGLLLLLGVGALALRRRRA